jgi:hypothetical protein
LQTKGKRVFLRLVFGALVVGVIMAILFLALGERFLLGALPDYTKNPTTISPSQAKTYLAVFKVNRLFRTPSAELEDRMSLALLYSAEKTNINYNEWAIKQAIQISDDYIVRNAGHRDRDMAYAISWRLWLGNKVHGIATLRDNTTTIKKLADDLRVRLDDASLHLDAYQRSTILSNLGLAHALYFRDREATEHYFGMANKVSNDAAQGGTPRNTYMKLYHGVGLCYLGIAEGAQMLADWGRAAHGNLLGFYKTITLEWDGAFMAALNRFSKDENHVCKQDSENLLKTVFRRTGKD